VRDFCDTALAAGSARPGSSFSREWDRRHAATNSQRDGWAAVGVNRRTDRPAFDLADHDTIQGDLFTQAAKTNARKQTGSCYTPPPIVDSMVDESLKAHLTRKLEETHAETRKRGGDQNSAGEKQEEAHTKSRRGRG
jgi:hypothetical protein